MQDILPQKACYSATTADNDLMKAAALKKGDTIGVMATSSWVAQEDLDQAKSFIEELGYKIFIHPQATEQLNQAAGTAQSKVNAFHDLLRNPDIKAIFGARGGNRAITMLDKIDFDLISSNPKIIMGYSDLTSILNASLHKSGLITFHGPLFRELPKRGELDQMWELLSGGTPAVDFSSSHILQEGAAEGPLIGGNLSVLQALTGTPFQPATDGAILFIEDVADHLSRYDRMLAHMKLAGWFGKISALVIGAFTDMEDDEDRPFGFTLEDIIREHFSDYDIPIIMNAPFGHGEQLYTFPIGGQAKLEAKNGTVAFTFTEPAVQA